MELKFNSKVKVVEAKQFEYYSDAERVLGMTSMTKTMARIIIRTMTKLTTVSLQSIRLHKGTGFPLRYYVCRGKAQN